MAYADELVRVSMKWRPPSAATSWAGEEAVTTFHLRHHHITGNGFTWSDQMPHLAEALAGKWSDHWSPEIVALLATGSSLVEIKAAHIDSAGHVIDEGAFSGSPLPLVGAGGTNMMPPEVALCVSAWAYTPGGFAVNKGRKRGRFYLPYIATARSTSQGRLDPDVGAAAATNFQDLFNDIQGMHTFNEDTPPDPNPDYWDFVVASKVDASWENVDYVSVDDKFDSQRRRQHQAAAQRWVEPISH
jgi:hypothetical protein